MVYSRLPRAILLCLLSLAVTAAFLSGCQSQKTEPTLPSIDRSELFADSQVVFRISNTTDMLEAVKKSPLGELWNSPEMEAFRDGRTMDEHIQEAMRTNSDSATEDRLGEIYLEEIKMLKGEVILGFEFNDQDAEPKMCIAAAMTKEAFDRSLELDARIHELEDTETITATENFNGIEIHTYVVKGEAEDDDEFHYQAFYKGTILMGEKKEWLEKSLAALMERSVREPADAPSAALLLKPGLLAQMKQKMLENLPEERDATDVDRLVSSLGVEAIGETGITYTMKPESAQLDLTVQKTGEWDRGLMLFIPTEPAPADYRISYMPEEPASYGVARTDFARIWAEIPVILKQIAPDMEAKFNLGVGSIGGMLQINIDKDLFGNLDNLMFNYSRIVEERQEWIYGFRVKDAAAMNQMLFTLFDENAIIRSQLGDMYREVTIQGNTLHMLKIPGASMDAEGPVFQNFGVVVLDQALLVGHENLLMDHVQSTADKSGEPAFYKSDKYTAMMENIPSGAFRYSMGSLSKIGEYTLAKIRESESHEDDLFADDEMEGPDVEEAFMDRFLEGFKYDQLPADEVIAGYLGDFEGYSLANEKGLESVLTIRYPRKKQTD